jgi:8-oxo-dGTP pyrophosphatase MutT (NUDIX family)
MEIVYAGDAYPEQVKKTIFLAGPTSRGDGTPWRGDALEALEKMGYDGHVFVPEPRDGQWAEDYDDQVDWEDEGLRRADVIVFWVPRDIEGRMPGFTTNDEWGCWKHSGKVVWGNPKDAEKVRYQRHYAEKLGVPVGDSLEATLGHALKKLGDGAFRIEGEVTVPLHIWQRPDFQKWYESQTAVGNTLNWVKVEWAFWVGQKRERLFLYSVHASVYVSSEDRNKENEVVVLRPDISTVFLYRNTPETTKVVLVREFRSPARNAEGFVFELPGGSSVSDDGDALTAASEELSEEVGINIQPSRLVPLSSRQMGATLCGYHSHLYACELTEEELERIEADKSTHGADDGERITLHVWTKEEILRRGDRVDWPMLGMIHEGLDYAGRD